MLNTHAKNNNPPKPPDKQIKIDVTANPTPLPSLQDKIDPENEQV